MKIILEEQIIDEVSRLCIEACTYINKDVLEKLNTHYENEQGLSKTIIGQIIENDNLAKEENIPMCQDTGICVVLVELGNEVYNLFNSLFIKIYILSLKPRKIPFTCHFNILA